MAFLKNALFLCCIIAASNCKPIAQTLAGSSKDVSAESAQLKRALVINSNLPFVTQQHIAQALDQVYSQTTSGNLRVELFQNQLMALVPNVYWDVVTNYHYVRYFSKFNIQLKASNNDQVIAFAK